MKKFTLLSAVLVAGMATAQVQVPMNMEIRKAEFKSIEMTAEVTMEEWNAEYVAKQQKAAAANYAAHDYYFTEGMMHFGYTPQFYGLMSSFIAVPYLDSVVWTNYYGPTSWYSQANNSLVAENSETFVTGYGIDGQYYLPYTTDHTLTQGGQTYNIKGYKYAAGNENGGYVASAVSPVIISTGEMIPMTLCGMKTDPMNNESGADFYQIGAILEHPLHIYNTFKISPFGNRIKTTVSKLQIVINNTNFGCDINIYGSVQIPLYCGFTYFCIFIITITYNL